MMSMAAAASEEEIGTFTGGTRVLISFGAASGGFELSLALRHEIYAHLKRSPEKEPALVYIDAESLREATGTKYTPNVDLDSFAMSNPKWAQFYKGAMGHCTTMIFLITAQWLRSKYCWEELEWFAERLATSSVRPIVLIFPDANAVLLQRRVETRHGTSHRVDDLLAITRGPWAVKIPINTVAPSAVRHVAVEHSTVAAGQAGKTLHFNYAISEHELAAVLANVRVD
jgi:hypothetical protein